MVRVFQKILEMSFQASFVIGAVILIRMLLKKAPRKYMCILWLAVLVRLLCPFAFSVELDFLPEVYPLRSQEAFNSTMTIGDYGEKENVISAQWENEKDSEGILTNSSELEIVGNEKAFYRVIGSVWLLGIFLMLLWNGTIDLKLRREIRRSGYLEKPGQWSVEGLETPFVMGVLRPQIYLPANLPQKEYAFILLHEQTHIRRKDPLIKFAGFVALCIHWFNPLAWAAFYFMSADMEMACDEAVLDKMGEEIKEAYSTALLHLSIEGPAFSGLASGFGELGPKKRICHILNYHKAGMGRMMFVVPIVVFVAIGLLLNPKTGKDGTKALAAESQKPTERMQGAAAGEEETRMHLELVKVENQAPGYILYIRKIQDDTGKAVRFERYPLLDASHVIEVEPVEALGEGYGYYLEQEDTLAIAFTYQKEESPILIQIDGLEYRFEPAKTEGKELAWNVKLEEMGPEAMIASAIVYPKSLRLKLTGIEEERWLSTMTLLMDGKSDRPQGPSNNHYDKKAKELVLVYTFDEEVPKEGMVFRAGVMDYEQKTKTFYDHELPALHEI